MKHDTVRSRILHAFHNTEEMLTRQEVLERARTNDVNELRHLCDGDLIARDADRYRITNHGLERLRL